MPGELEFVLHKRRHGNEKPGRQVESSPGSEQLEKAHGQKRRPRADKSEKKKKKKIIING